VLPLHSNLTKNISPRWRVLMIFYFKNITAMGPPCIIARMVVSHTFMQSDRFRIRASLSNDVGSTVYSNNAERVSLSRLEIGHVDWPSSNNNLSRDPLILVCVTVIIIIIIIIIIHKTIFIVLPPTARSHMREFTLTPLSESQSTPKMQTWVLSPPV